MTCVSKELVVLTTPNTNVTGRLKAGHRDYGVCCNREKGIRNDRVHGVSQWMKDRQVGLCARTFSPGKPSI